ncbi:MAG: MFS transporter [Candidatus Heimdallarchaeota archaeon]|nr:MFS transporter [Candidatus Heimdallarchaeota archaeon]MCK4252940.1 MFS transporter [Candidatus Heimdallarchaeota archaeon]
MSNKSSNKLDGTLDKTNDSDDLYTQKRPTLSFIGILISTFFLRVAFGSTTVLMPIYIFLHLQMEGWEANLSIIFVEITYAIAVIISSGYFGFRSDVSDAKRWILLGTAAGGLILIGYGICALNWQGWIGIIPLANGLMIFGMSLFHFLHGLAGSIKVNASYGYISRFSVYETRATKMGLYNVAVSGGRSAGVLLAGVLYNSIVGVNELIRLGGINLFAKINELSLSARNVITYWMPNNPQRLAYLYLLFAFAIIISAVVVFLMIDKTKPVLEHEEYSVKQELLMSWKLMIDKSRRGIVLPLLGTAAIIGILNNWGFLILSIESSPADAGLTTVVFTLTMGLPMVFWGWIADKIGRRKALSIGVAGLLMMAVVIGIAFFGNFMTGGQPWYDPTSEFDPNGFTSNWWILILLVVSLILGSAYFPAISGRLGDSSSIGMDEERHGSTMSIQQTIISVSEIIGIILGGIALMIVFALSDRTDNFAYNLIGLLIPIVLLLIFTTIASFLWPEEEEFIDTSKVRRKDKEAEPEEA